MVNDVNGDGRFSKRDLFNSDLDSDEVEKILNFILHLSPANMKEGRSLMAHSGYIYDFNHAPDTNHHIDNITDGKGDGFEILHKYDLKNLTDEEREKISKVADGSSDRIAGVLARYGYAERVHDGGSIVSENSGTMESNDGLDSGQLSEKSDIQRRERESGRNSEENTSVDQQRYSFTHETDDQRKAREAIDEWIAREVQPIIDRNSEREAKEPKSSAKEILGTIASKKDWGEEG